MPQSFPPLDEAQFNAVAERVIASAPQGLDEASFMSLLDEEVNKAEAMQAMVASGKQDLSKDLSVAAGIAAGPAILPGAIASGGAYYLGERLKGQNRGEAAKAGLTEGALSAGIGTGLKALSGPVSRVLDSGAMRFVKGGIKAPLQYLEHMAGAGAAGADAMEDRIARTVLDSGVNPMRAKGARRLQGDINKTAAARTAKIEAAPDVPVPGSGNRATKAFHRVMKGRTNQTDATKELKQVRAVMRSQAANPRFGANDTGELPDLTPKELAELITGDNRTLSEAYGRTPKPARLEAVKEAKAARAGALDEAAGTKELSARMRDLIDVRNVSDLARQRAGKRDAIGITDIISLSAGRPEVLAATTMMRPAMQVGTGRTLGRASRAAAGANTSALRELLRGATPDAVRSLLGELMASHEQD